MEDPRELLEHAFLSASTDLKASKISDVTLLRRVELIARNPQNRAAVRLVLSCALAKASRPELDIRKPYTEIGTADAFSGRTFDETYLTAFIQKHRLPCNPTTAFLTPALRNRNQMLTADLNVVGRPPEVYYAALELLTDVAENRLSAKMLLEETVRQLVLVREENLQRMTSLLAQLGSARASLSLSSEATVTLLEQHLKLPNSSRLPVLMVAAAYKAAGPALGEHVRALSGHNAADRQTGALGDVEIVLTDDTQIVTAFEMKTRRVTREDIDLALQKLALCPIDNYIFITTEPIDPLLEEYARGLYALTGGVEVVLLDCLSFIRYYLHFFHRKRSEFLAAYQRLLLEEPDSAVRPALKEAWLALRYAAESVEAEN